MKTTSRQSILLSFRIWSSMLFLAGLLFTSFSSSAQLQGASVAKRGNGIYRGDIFWINWDVNNDGRPGDIVGGAAGSSVVRTVTTPKGVTYTMTITKITGENIASYVPGQFDYDDIKTGYNWFTQAINTNGPTNLANGYTNGYNFAGGTITNAYDNLTDAHNSVIGLANAVNGETVNFRISISASYQGQSVNIPGMVAAGAESLDHSSSTGNESEIFTTNGEIWQAFERVQNNFQGPDRATTFETVADVSNGGKTVMDRNGDTSPETTEGPGTMLWFSRDASEITVTLDGKGVEAIAIGFIGTDDFGDAPISYGNVSHILDVIFNGGALPTTNTTGLQLDNHLLATQSDAISSLGEIALLNITQPYSDDLLGDDNSGAADDEDALPNPYSATVVNGANSLGITVPVRNNNTYAMRVWGWVDINLDGAFQLNERAVAAEVAEGFTGSVNINFQNLPGTFQPFKKYPMRLRLVQAGGLPVDDVATTNVDEGSFGSAVGGEVEDHFVKIPDADLSGKVFIDPNRNKLLDNGEQLYPNSDMYVYIVDANNNVVAKDTVVNGLYTLGGVPTGVNLTGLGYKVIGSSQNVAVGETLTAGAAPTAYSISGEDLSIAGSNVVTGSSNADFIVELTGTVPTTGISEVNLGIFDPALPVNFGSINARIVNGVLRVDWRTLTETNNDHFIIELSEDGKTFHEIGNVKTLAENGNSDTNIDYQFSLDNVQEATMPVVVIISLLLIGLTMMKRRRIALFVVATVLLGAISCQKKDMLNTEKATYYIKITQVDKDGTMTTSKAIKVINE